MTNKELFYYTGKCLMLDDHPEFRNEIIGKIKSNSIDWSKFVNLWSNHLIIPSIYLKFKAQDILSYLPEELAKHLEGIYELNLIRNNRIIEQLQVITATLNRNNIYPIFLKGSGNLLDQLYCDKGERILGDIDFLVSKNDYLQTAKLLEEIGYSIYLPYYGEVENLKHYPRIAKPGCPAVLEIHQLPVTVRFETWFNAEMIDQDKKPVKSLPGSFVLSDSHNIILNFIHSQLDHEGHSYGIVSFRDLYDLYLLSKRTPLTQTINNIQTREKAIAYFAFADKAFGLNKKFFFDTNFSAWLFAKKHDLNYSSFFFYHSYRSTLYMIKRIFVGAIGQVIKSFYSKEMRRSVIKRVTSRKWYMAHLHSYKHFFSPNK
jgi:hypothetical protein